MSCLVGMGNKVLIVRMTWRGCFAVENLKGFVCEFGEEGRRKSLDKKEEASGRSS